MTMILKRLLCSLLVLTQLSYGMAATPEPKKVMTGQQLEIFLTMFTQTTYSPKQIETLFSFSDLDDSSLSDVVTDLNKNLKEGELPKMKLVDGHFYFDNQRSDIHVTSYDPLKIEYKNKSWKYEPKKTAKDNYFALLKVLEDKETASLMNILIPRAEAQVRQSRAAKYAAAGLVIVGGVLFLAAGAVTIPVSVIALGAGAAAGVAGAYGWHSGKKEDIGNQKKWADALLRTQTLQVDCNADRAQLHGRLPNGQQIAIRFERAKVTPSQGLVGATSDWVWSKAFGPQPVAGSIETKQYISPNFGGRNVSERDVKTPLQRRSSFTEALEFTSPQAEALGMMLDCTKDMQQWTEDCLSRHNAQCTGIKPGVKLEYYELLKIAQEQADCTVKRAAILKDGRCMLPVAVYKNYFLRTHQIQSGVKKVKAAK